MESRTANPAASRILVTGGTGTLGRLVVAGLVGAGRDVRVLTRGRRGHDETERVEYVTCDLATGDGIDAALDGVEIIVHCAGTNKGDDLKTRHLAEAAVRAGVRHLVYISVVGADRVPVNGRLDRAAFAYFASKRASERVVAVSGVPWTTLRATQFHQSLLMLAGAMAKLPVIPTARGFRFQPVDAAEVAARLVELALGTPSGLVPDLAGPRIYEMAELIRVYMRATGRHRAIVRLPVPGTAAHAVRAGAVLAPDRAVGRATWNDFVAAHAGRSRDRVSAPA